MKRRNFIKTVSAAAIAATAVNPKNSPLSNPEKILKKVKPSKLNTGDTIALVTPGSYITQQERKDSIDNLISLGFKVIHSERLMMKNGYFSSAISKIS